MSSKLKRKNLMNIWVVKGSESVVASIIVAKRGRGCIGSPSMENSHHLGVFTSQCLSRIGYCTERNKKVEVTPQIQLFTPA